MRHCENGSVVNLIKRRLALLSVVVFIVIVVPRVVWLVVLVVFCLAMHFPNIKGCGKTVINGFLRLLNVDKSLKYILTHCVSVGN